MNDLETGIMIQRLVVQGPGLPEAVLTFADGLNVVSGASDTGKSFAFSCIDFAFGASKPPRPIPQSFGYECVRLHIQTRGDKQVFIIERPFKGRSVRIIREIDGEEADEISLPAQHSGTNPSTLSGFLLEQIGLWGVQIRKNAKGERRSVSFRDFAHLCLIDEERIIAERPPHLSGQVVTATAEGEFFRTLITGNESGAEASATPKSVNRQGIDAKLELLDRMIRAEEEALKQLEIAPVQIPEELQRLDFEMIRTSSGFDDSRISLVDLEGQLERLNGVARQTQGRASVVSGLLSRFDLLDEHYETNIKRLSLIAEAGSLLASLPSSNCPLCGALVSDQRPDQCSATDDPESVKVAALQEVSKFSGLKRDLNSMIQELHRESNQLETRKAEVSREITAIENEINVQLQPRIQSSSETMAAQRARRDLLVQGSVRLESIAQLRNVRTELELARSESKPEQAAQSETASATDLDTFAAVVGEVLLKWNYPDPGDVYFSVEAQDLIIGEHGRASHGKGVRALTCAAFIVGAMKHCQDARLPHPSLVVLDSPLVAYKEPDSDEARGLEEANVKESFFESLSDGYVGGQVIVFENEAPPSDLQGRATLHYFTKSPSGRYGFFPELT